MNRGFTVVIPARLSSTRLPGKALLPIAGRPMIQHTFERATESRAARVVVATDDERIAEAGRGFGAPVLMTGSRHRSGTERVAEAASLLALGGDEVVVNVQGDEPLMPPALVSQVAEDLVAHPAAQMATLCGTLTCAKDLFDSTVVKIVTDREGYALYFSRAAIPWHRGYFETGTLPDRAKVRRHIGVYAYRVHYLHTYVSQAAPEIEEAEALEQLRALYHGARIHVTQAREEPGPDVDTPRDLERVRSLISGAARSPAG